MGKIKTQQRATGSPTEGGKKMDRLEFTLKMLSILDFEMGQIIKDMEKTIEEEKK